MLGFLKKHRALTAHFPNNIKGSGAAITNETLRKYISFLAKGLEGVNHASIQNFDETNLSDDPSKKKVLVRCGVKYHENIRNLSKTSVSLMFQFSGYITSR
jgi:hypothetical protein